MNTEETQKLFKWGRVALIVLAVFLAVETLGALKNLRNVNPAYNSISVTGEGEAVSIPDVATFSFTVSSDAKLVSDAQKNVTEKVNAIIDGLETLGIEKKDIKTTDYSVWPKYKFDRIICSPGIYCPPSEPVQDGYTANHSISVTVRKTEDAGTAIALAGEKGATGLSSISFTTDDPDKVVAEARAQAIEDAKSKAKLLSEELGVKLVRVVNFYDNTDRGPMPYYAEGMGGDMAKSSTSVAPTIPVGENKVMVSVTVVYEIR